MKINIESILEDRNKTIYWLAKATGISYSTVFNLSKNKTKSIEFDTLEKICLSLKCTPNDILILSSHTP